MNVNEPVRMKLVSVVFGMKPTLQCFHCRCMLLLLVSNEPSQWGAADAEIKVPSDENTEFKGSAFKAWSRSVYCNACYAYCQEFLPC